ncbi:unnamed protein product [Didymodactylos carnosus]|uniref:RNA-dependent RNA polymerase n=1 Tax=Didymodactylos carnosus TaxID=1234261 RepID=A0A8S2CYM9_9BILA|nr:unnamed protein product [Didymodactylos carnosus]CAF3553084.1 unnamed protein product [Didymodactylos carnosus]
MAGDTNEHHHNDWDQLVSCKFKNILLEDCGKIIGRNLIQILHLNNIDEKAIKSSTNDDYESLFTRREANKIRDNLYKVLTEAYTHVWFTITQDPFHSVEELSISKKNVVIPQAPPIYRAHCRFGSMYSYSTFYSHGPQDRELRQIKITETTINGAKIPLAIRIHWTEQITIRIPLESIDRQKILINASNIARREEHIQIVLMLKYAVAIHQDRKQQQYGKDQRVCNDESNELYKTISNSSDILIQFTSSEQALQFLNQITSDKRKSEFNFVLLHSEPWSETMTTQPPPNINHLKNPSFKKAYGLYELLDTMGYVFQDKYRQSRTVQNILHDPRANYDLYCYLEQQLIVDHCYGIERKLIKDYQVYLAKKKKEDKQTLSKENDQYSIPCCTLTPLRTIYRQFETNSGSRALRHSQFQSTNEEPNFLLVHFREEDNTKLKDFNEQIKRRLKSKMINGLDCVYKNYKFIGSSTSQLKELSFWFILLPQNMKTVDQAIATLGEFDAIKNLATHVARVGQFFTTTKTVDINLTFIDQNRPRQNQCYYACQIDDIKRNNYCFTDGCGKISLGLAIEVARKLKLEKDYIPSAYQVRIAGCKGMLAIDYESNQNDFYVKVRESMKKFDSPHWNLEICECLNNQVILLLSDLGNELPIFLSLQQQSLSPSNTYWDPIKDLGTTTNSVVAQKKSNYAIVKENLLKNRIPIPPKDGRNMFGLADETGQLKYGECFIQYTCLDDESSKGKLRIVEGDVLVTKNPCLYPGDFRKLKAVNVPQLREHIHDCIVFPVNGPRPHSNEISGSDLDGDQYWVYWGKDFHINHVVPPLTYTATEKTEVPRITHELIIDHIVNTFGTAKQGLICDIHLVVANICGVRSEECKKLAELFARAVDAPKTGEDVPMDLVEKYREQYAYRHGYPQYMMKFNQRICRSDSVMEHLFLNGKKILFNQMENYSFSSYQSSSHRQHQRPVEQVKSTFIVQENESTTSQNSSATLQKQKSRATLSNNEIQPL